MNVSQQEFIKKAQNEGSIISRDRLGILYNYCVKTEGEIWECGVYKGGSTLALSMFNRTIRAFDSFEGLPKPSKYDNFCKEGMFHDTSFGDKIASTPSNLYIYKGFIPYTFKELGGCKIGFAHIDVDLYESTLECCKFIVPRLAKNGIILFDDYGFEKCKGVKKAIDEFFGVHIKVLKTKQAVYEI
jgi:hypothetical protein